MKIQALMLCLTALITHAPAQAQRLDVSYTIRPYVVSSGLHDGDGVASRMAYEEVVQVPDASWLRVHFSRARTAKVWRRSCRHGPGLPGPPRKPIDRINFRNTG